MVYYDIMKAKERQTVNLNLDAIKERLADRAMPIYDAVFHGVRSLIKSGAWEAGAKLPPDKIMADELGISHITLGRALNELRRQGFLRRQRALGTFVNKLLTEQDTAVSGSRIAVVFDAVHERTFREVLFIGLHRQIKKHGGSMVFFDADGSAQKQIAILKDISRNSDFSACIFWSILDAAQARELIEWDGAHCPLVFLDQYYDNLNHDGVIYDNFGGGRELGLQLKLLGKKRICFIEDESQLTLSSVRDRLRGILAGVGDIPVERLVVSHGQVAPLVVSEPNTTAFVASSHMLWLSIYEHVEAARPDLYTFFNDSDQPNEHCAGARYDNLELAELALSVVQSRLNGDDQPAIRLTAKAKIVLNSPEQMLRA